MRHVRHTRREVDGEVRQFKRGDNRGGTWVRRERGIPFPDHYGVEFRESHIGVRPHPSTRESLASRCTLDIGDDPKGGVLDGEDFLQERRREVGEHFIPRRSHDGQEHVPTGIVGGAVESHTGIRRTKSQRRFRVEPGQDGGCPCRAVVWGDVVQRQAAARIVTHGHTRRTNHDPVIHVVEHVLPLQPHKPRDAVGVHGVPGYHERHRVLRGRQGLHKRIFERDPEGSVHLFKDQRPHIPRVQVPRDFILVAGRCILLPLSNPETELAVPVADYAPVDGLKDLLEPANEPIVQRDVPTSRTIPISILPTASTKGRCAVAPVGLGRADGQRRPPMRIQCGYLPCRKHGYLAHPVRHRHGANVERIR